MLPAHARLLEGAEYRHGARLLRRKYPVLHGVVVPRYIASCDPNTDTRCMPS
jgi:hypothetical protein